MIEFPCHCGSKLSVPSDMAGSVIQCPDCSRLNDVPTLVELEHMESDGALRMGPKVEPTEDSRTRVAQLTRAFTRSHFDEHGNPIDLRPTFDQILDQGVDDGTLPLAEEIRAEQPKYDPDTGELVRPLDIKPENAPPAGAHPAVKAADAKRTLGYASAPIAPPITFANLSMRLLAPVNIFVMLIILVAHAVVTPVNVLMAVGIFLVAPLWVMGAMFFIGHYGCVIDDIGPGEQEELPRPMRDFSLSEDIWRPFVHVAGSALICFGLAIIAYNKGAPQLMVLGLALAGTYFYPAALLTLATSGTSFNLRPDRVMGVIGIIGGKYFVLVATFVIAVVSYYIGLWRVNIDLVLLFVPKSTAKIFSSGYPWWFQPWIAYPLLLAGIYFSHWFCVALGLVYRARQPQFPWILQRHIPTKLAERNRPSPQRVANTNSGKARARMVEPLAPRIPR